MVRMHEARLMVLILDCTCEFLELALCDITSQHFQRCYLGNLTIKCKLKTITVIISAADHQQGL